MAARKRRDAPRCLDHSLGVRPGLLRRRGTLRAGAPVRRHRRNRDCATETNRFNRRPRSGYWVMFCGLLIVFLLSGLVLMISVFFPFDDRLRFRYLNFVFPILVFLALGFEAKQFSAVTNVLKRRLIRVVILITWLGCAVGFYFVARDSRLAFVDVPEFYFAYHATVSDHVNMLGAYGPIVGIVWICVGGLPSCRHEDLAYCDQLAGAHSLKYRLTPELLRRPKLPGAWR